MGLFEIHCHTGEVSVCAWVDAISIVRMHKEAGFEGICITDHYHEEFFKKHSGLKDKEIVDIYLSGYRLARKEGSRIGIKVMLGMEIRFEDNDNDYLVYGITEDMLFENPYMFRMGLEDFSDMARVNGLLLIQAHPFRDNMTRVNPRFIDGIETVNGNIRHNSRNHLSESYAIVNNLRKMGGSDFHRECDLNMVAMHFFDEINSEADLVKSIKDGNYAIVHEPFLIQGQV
jgi:predicted metal-dependent phosphoesterase TrpH